MDKKMFEEPKNSIKQTPLDCCMDAFEEIFTDAEITIHDLDRPAYIEALEEALYTWEAIHHKG